LSIPEIFENWKKSEFSKFCKKIISRTRTENALTPINKKSEYFFSHPKKHFIEDFKNGHF